MSSLENRGGGGGGGWMNEGVHSRYHNVKNSGGRIDKGGALMVDYDTVMCMDIHVTYVTSWQPNLSLQVQ